MFRIQLLSLLAFASLIFREVNAAEPIAPPKQGKLYQGLYFDNPVPGNDPTEHDISSTDVERWEQTLGTHTTWIYFSNNWSESRRFPSETCAWIRGLGKVPYIRLMLRSTLEQNRPEKVFSLTDIIAGKFDPDLKQWANDARTFNSPILVEWGTEPNGSWFSWNGKWNGGAVEGPRRYITAYRHIVDLIRVEGGEKLQWVWHANWLDQPEAKWNRFENYYPGDNYCDWLALSAYGPLSPDARHGTESLRFKLRTAYPRLTKLAPAKPIVLAEFGCDIHHRNIDASEWAKGAFEELFSGRWPALIGFCWWNEWWENDDKKEHNTDTIVLHDAKLTRVFREELAKHRSAIQDGPIARESQELQALQRLQER